MKKLLLLVILLATIFSVARAQTFTEVNSDGVAIQYTVTEDNFVKVIQNAYSGRLVVPSQVLHEGVTYTVNEVANDAFNGGSAQLYYVELPATLEKLGFSQFQSIGLDTLVLNSVTPPTNAYGVYYGDDLVRSVFGNDRIKNMVVIVPDGYLNTYRFREWGLFRLLQSPSAVTLTMFAPRNVYLSLHDRILHNFSDAPAYVTIYAEIGERLWLTLYHENYDTVFVGWDNGGIYWTEVTGADTIYPIYQPVSYSQLDVNNVNALVKFTGQMSFYDGVAHYAVPSDSSSSTLYSNGLWLSYKNGRPSSANRFGVGDFAPGPVSVDGAHTNDLQTRMDFNRVWAVSRAEIDSFIANVGTPGYEIPENILTWPGNGGEGYASQLAPYYDADGDSIYDASHGDYPLIKGDRMIFSIFNDNCFHPETKYEPLGVEVHMSAYAFDEPNDTALNNTVFVSYKVINRSANAYYNETYFGAFTDYDIGNAGDDFVGCDVKNGMAYAYNGTSIDLEYGENPPAQGTIILGGPYAMPDGKDNPVIDIEKMQQFFPTQLANYQLQEGGYDTVRLTADADLYYPAAWSFVPDTSRWVNSSINGLNYGNNIIDDERLGMTSFICYDNSISPIMGEPTNGFDYHAYMAGHWKNGESMCHGGYGRNVGTGSGECTYFMYPHDSDPLHWGTNGIVPQLNPNDWNEVTGGNVPGDRRGVQGCGPFTMLPGSEHTLDLAFVTAFGNNGPWSSVEKLQSYASNVRRQFVHDTTDSGRPFTYRPYSAPIVGIDAVSTVQTVKVYPNPTHDYITISLSNDIPTDITVYDIRGNKVLACNDVREMVTINLSTLPRGVYILHCGNNVSRLVKL